MRLKNSEMATKELLQDLHSSQHGKCRICSGPLAEWQYEDEPVCAACEDEHLLLSQKEW
jgi:hypothetical protein